MRNLYRHFQITSACLLCLLVFPGAAWPDHTPKTELRAAFIYNFIRYTEWPAHIEKSPSKNFVICANADDTHFETLKENLEAKQIKNKSILVRKVRGLQDIPGCWIVFDSPSNDVLKLSAEINRGGQGILTIGHYPDTIQDSDVIRFFIENDKLRFEINPVLAHQAGLTFSSKLLNLARILLDINAGDIKQ